MINSDFWDQRSEELKRAFLAGKAGGPGVSSYIGTRIKELRNEQGHGQGQRDREQERGRERERDGRDTPQRGESTISGQPTADGGQPENTKRDKQGGSENA